MNKGAGGHHVDHAEIEDVNTFKPPHGWNYPKWLQWREVRTKDYYPSVRIGLSPGLQHKPTVKMDCQFDSGSAFPLLVCLEEIAISYHQTLVNAGAISWGNNPDPVELFKAAFQLSDETLIASLGDKRGYPFFLDHYLAQEGFFPNLFYWQDHFGRWHTVAAKRAIEVGRYSYALPKAQWEKIYGLNKQRTAVVGRAFFQLLPATLVLSFPYTTTKIYKGYPILPSEERDSDEPSKYYWAVRIAMSERNPLSVANIIELYSAKERVPDKKLRRSPSKGGISTRTQDIRGIHRDDQAWWIAFQDPQHADDFSRYLRSKRFPVDESLYSFPEKQSVAPCVPSNP